MVATRSPKVLWDHCLEWYALVRSATCNSNFELAGQVPETIMKGETYDISLLAGYGWYDWVYYFDLAASYPEDKEKLGRYLGPATDMGPAQAAKILAESGMIKVRSTYRHLNADELRDENVLRKQAEYDATVKEKLGKSAKADEYDGLVDIETPTYEPYEDDDDPRPKETPDVDDITPDTFDNYVGADVLLPKGSEMVTGKVKRRSKDGDGKLQGTAHQNPILDTRMYVVEFPDGEVSEYAANVIAENMYSQCDVDGNQFVLLDCIVDHRKSKDAVATSDQYVVVKGRRHQRKTTKGWQLCCQWKDGTTTWERLAGLKESNPIEVAEYVVLLDCIVDHRKSKDAVATSDQYVVVKGRRHQRKTTKGWQLCCQWKDGTTTWERLAGLKESNPIEVAEYAVAKEIDHEPAFNWWVKKFLRRRDRILSALKNTRYHKRTHKFGIEIPKTVAEAYELDRKNGNDLWRKAIEKEIEAVRVAFKLLADDETPLPTYQEIRCHMVFDVKMEDFRRKARFVAGEKLQRHSHMPVWCQEKVYESR